MKNQRGVRSLIISGMTRDQLVKFIMRKNGTRSATDLSVHSDGELRKIANDVDEQTVEARHKNKKR
jgi:hypothetical protein